MVQVIFHHKNGDMQEIDAPENFSLMQAAKQHNVDGIEGVCGGCMACATCHVIVAPAWEERVIAQDNEKSDEEEDTLDTAFHVEDTSRLACQIKLTPALDGLEVALPGAEPIWRKSA